MTSRSRPVLGFLLGGLVFGVLAGVVLATIALVTTPERSFATVQPAMGFVLFSIFLGATGAIAGLATLIAWLALGSQSQARPVAMVVCAAVFGVVSAVGTFVLTSGTLAVAIAALLVGGAFGTVAAFWSRRGARQNDAPDRSLLKEVPGRER